ncbi:MAG: sensor histidine kinase [Bacilli bacterium]
MPGHSNRTRTRLSTADARLMRRQRLRLALVNTVVLAVIWSLLSVFVYVLLAQATANSIDARLRLFADQAMEYGEPGRVVTEPGQLLASEQDRLYAIWRVGAGAPKLQMSSVMSPALLAKLRMLAVGYAASPLRVTINTAHTRFDVLQMNTVNHGIRERIQVLSDVSPEHELLAQLAGLFFLAGILGIVCTIAGAYFLGSWTLRPIMAARVHEQELIADVSHELRTPLSVLQANFEMLLRHTDDDASLHKALRWLTPIYAETKRMRRLVEELLDMAHLDAQGGSLSLQPVDLTGLCREIAALYEPVLEETDIQFTAAIDQGVVVQGDPSRLRQLLLILLDNARKYTERGTLSLRLERRGQHYDLIVADTGRGMEPALLAKVTERFVRGEPARTRSSEARGAEGDAQGAASEEEVDSGFASTGAERTSTGLGLAIAKRIVDGMHGKLLIASVIGQGTQVTVRLLRHGHNILR